MLHISQKNYIFAAYFGRVGSRGLDNDKDTTTLTTGNNNIDNWKQQH